VAVGDHQLDTAQAAAGELSQESGPERLGLRSADVHAEHLAAPVAIDADRDDDGDRDDAAGPTHLHVGRIDPEVKPIAFERALEEGLHLAVDLFARARDLAPGDAAHAHRLDQVVDRAGGDALDVRPPGSPP
jgi:hypothetical protein